jgi:FeoA domain
VRISVKSSNYDGTISLSLDKNQIRLGASAAQRIWVVKS